MTDTYRIITAVRSTLAKRQGHVGRPMSLRIVFFVWLFLLLASILGAAWFDFGAVR